jgi:ABC-type multidrug transport system fused ATPase/permease subunit
MVTSYQKSPSPLRLVERTQFWKDNSMVLQELGHVKKLVFFAVFFPLLSAAFEGFGIGFLFAFLQTIVTPNPPPFAIGIQWFDIWVLGSQSSTQEQLYRICALILASTWIRAFFNYLSSYSSELMKLTLVDRLNQKVFEQIQALSLSFFNSSRSGEIVNILTTEMGRFQQAVTVFNFGIFKLLAGLVYIFILLKISWQLATVSAVLFGCITFFISTFNTRIREDSFPVSKANARFTEKAIEIINGIRTINAFATQDFERRRFYQASDRVVKTSLHSLKRYLLVRPLLEGMVTTVLVGMIIAGLTIFVSNGTIQTATLLTFLLVLFRLLPSLQEVSGALASFSGFQGSIQTISNFLSPFEKPYLKSGDRTFYGLQNSIEFLNVDFGYNPDRLVIHDLNLTIEKGKTVALVGSSGAGKTTLSDLIPRFYDPVEGKILLDGVNLCEFNVQSVRRRIAVVSQDTFIFDASVRENIAYGLDDVNDQVIWDAARAANALEFLQALPDGLNTRLGERGALLSGGQRQRIAIARALLRDPEILILDEATSALDSVSEKLIQEAIEKLSVGRTVIAIAHRLSTIIRADKVVVLNSGRIVEEGRYSELVAQRGELWKYHQMQHEDPQYAS